MAQIGPKVEMFAGMRNGAIKVARNRDPSDEARRVICVKRRVREGVGDDGF